MYGEMGEELFLIVVAVRLAIAIAVDVAEAVTVVARGGAGRTVEEQGHVGVGLVEIKFVNFFEQVAVHQPYAHHEERHVGMALHDVGVGHHVDGRAVHDDGIVARAERLEQLGEAVALEEFGGVGRHHADGDDVYAAVELVGENDVVEVVGGSAEVGTKSLLGKFCHLGEGAVAEVDVDGEHALAAEGERLGEVAGDETLAAAGVETGDHDDGGDAGLLLHEVVEFGAHEAERLVDEVAAVFLDVDFALGIAWLALPPMLLGGDERNFADVGHAHGLEILAAAYGAVEELAEEEQAAGHGQTEGEGDEEDAAAPGRSDATAVGRLYDARVPRGEGFGEFVFLALLEKVDVEGFLDLLLAVDAEELLCLARGGGYLLVGEGLVGFGGGDLLAELRDEVFEGAHDGGFLRGEVAVHLLHEGVVLATVGEEVIAHEQGLVVGCDLGFHARAAYTAVGGQELPGAGAVGEIVLDVDGHGELVVELNKLVGIFAALLHVHAGCLLEVGHEVAALVVGYLAVNVAEFFGEGGEALGDELRGALGDEVAVAHPMLVVDLHEGEQQVVGAGGHLVADAEVENGALFVGERHGEAAGIARGDGGRGVFRDGDFFAIVVAHACGRFFDADFAGGRVECGTEARVDILHLYFLLSVDYEVADSHAAVVVHLHLEGEGQRRFTVGDVDGHGRIVVERQSVQAFAHGDLQVEPEALGGFLHQYGCAKREHFVVDVGV